MRGTDVSFYFKMFTQMEPKGFSIGNNFFSQLSVNHFSGAWVAGKTNETQSNEMSHRSVLKKLTKIEIMKDKIKFRNVYLKSRKLAAAGRKNTSDF